MEESQAEVWVDVVTPKKERAKSRASKSSGSGPLLQDNFMIKRDKCCLTSPAPPWHWYHWEMRQGTDAKAENKSMEEGQGAPVSLSLAQKHKGRVAGPITSTATCLGRGEDRFALLCPEAHQPALFKNRQDKAERQILPRCCHPGREMREIKEEWYSEVNPNPDKMPTRPKTSR